jgi:hypothetical protein
VQHLEIGGNKTVAESFFESLKRDFVKKALYDIAKIVLLLILTVSGSLLASKLLVLNFAALAPFKWYLAAIFGSSGALTFLLLYRRFNRFRPNFPRLDFDFQVLEKEITYEYLDKTHMVYKKRNRIKALKNGLDTYRDKYRWTGRGDIVIKSGIPEQQITETVRKNVWQVYEIRLQRSLNRGDIIETEAIWELEDQANRAVPFFSATIEEPTDLLRFSLILNPSLGVREVTCETSTGIGSGKPFDSFARQLDKHSEASWEIKNPKLLYYYEMKWSMN